MALPPPGTPWPPPAHAVAYDALAVWSAWFSSDRDALARVYSGRAGTLPPDRPAQLRGGLVGRAARWFWGQPVNPAQRSPRLHIPMAADICATSASMLFAERPTLTATDTATQARLDVLVGEDAIVRLHAAAEVQAGLAGVYLVGAYDEELADHPFTHAVHPDAAIPEWRMGRLVGVTFWRELARTDARVLRHLEHHGTQGTGPGRAGYVEHALYEGRADNLGRLVPLQEHPDTAVLVSDLMTAEGIIPTGLDRLDVTWIANAEDRRHRSDPIAHNLGRADLQGVEPVLDALDEAWTSWMRDLRLGKGRVHVPAGYLDSLGPGQGATWDADREVYTELNALVGSTSAAGLPITATQLAIRLDEHRGTCDALAQVAVSMAGYSPQTFGLVDEVAITATEVAAKERKTLSTRGQKARRWKLGLADHAEVLLLLDRNEFRSAVIPQRPDVELAPYTQAGPRELAETVQLLHAAEAASVEVRVRMAHPDWDDGRVRQEVVALKDERAELAPPDPFAQPPGA